MTLKSSSTHSYSGPKKNKQILISITLTVLGTLNRFLGSEQSCRKYVTTAMLWRTWKGKKKAN